MVILLLLVDEKQLLSADYKKERDRVLSADEIVQLYTLIKQEEDSYFNASNKRGVKVPLNQAKQCAIWLYSSILCRIGVF